MPETSATSEAIPAYLAGLIDGDGCIGIKRRKPSRANKMASPRYCAYFSIGMTDLEPVQFVADFVGARDLISRRERGRNKPFYELMLEHERAAKLLLAVLPYLIAKRRQAELALELREHQKTERAHRTKVAQVCTFKGGRAAGTSYRVMMHSDAYNATLEKLYFSANQGAARSGNGLRFQGDSSRN